jgi:hypothetical protein
MELKGQLGPHSQQIHPSIPIKSKVPKMYSHPHSTPHISKQLIVDVFGVYVEGDAFPSSLIDSNVSLK